jgi:hypothetical protein
METSRVKKATLLRFKVDQAFFMEIVVFHAEEIENRRCWSPASFHGPGYWKGYGIQGG